MEMAWCSVWSHNRTIYTGETSKTIIKVNFAKCASLPDPAAYSTQAATAIPTSHRFPRTRNPQRESIKALVDAASALNTSKPRQ